MNLVPILILTLISAPGRPGPVHLGAWMGAFSECNVNVMSLEPDLWLDPVPFPVSLSTYPYYYHLFNFDYDHVEFGSGRAKWVFCAVQVFLLSNQGSLLNTTAFGPKARFPIFPNSFCSIRKRWTNCVTLVVGLPREEWSDFLKQDPSFWSALLTSFEILEGLMTRQFFILGNETQEQNGLTNTRTCHYVCKACLRTNNNVTISPYSTSVLIPVELNPDEDVAAGLERTVSDARLGGRSLGFPVYSYLRPKLPVQFPQSLLSGISLRDYYARYRLQFTYIEVLQAILLQETPPLQPPFPHKEFLSRSITLDTYTNELRAKRLHLASSDSFNFITCHGLENRASLSVYLAPFDLQVWITLATVFLLLGTILMAALRLLNPSAASITITVISFRRISALWFYTLAILVENNWGKQNPLPGRRAAHVTRLVFAILAFVCIVLGCLYKGVLTRDIIAPLPNTIPYERVAELGDFSLLVLPTDVVLTGEEWASVGFHGATGVPEQSAEVNATLFINPGYSNLGKELETLFPFNSDMSSEFYYRLRVIPSMGQASRELGACDQKRALVGLQAELAQFLQAEDGVREQVGVGKDSFLPFFYYWQIPLGAGGYLDRRMSAIISSGLANLWEELSRRDWWQQRDMATGTGMSGDRALKANLGSLFKLLLLSHSIGLIIFLAEMFTVFGSRAWNRIPLKFAGRKCCFKKSPLKPFC